MTEFVFDSSALLALILREPGGDLDDLLDRAAISSDHLVEVLTKMIDLGQWASEGYRVPATESSPSEEEL